MVFHTVPRRSLKRGLKFFHGNVFCFLSHPSLLLFICMTKLNDFILRNKSAELSATLIFGNVEPGACLRTVQQRRGRGKGTPGKLGWGLPVCLDIKRFQISQGILTEINKKKLKKICILISRRNSTPKQKSKNYDIYDRIQTKTAGNTYPLALHKRIWPKINAKIGVTEGLNLPPSLLFFLASFFWFFLRLRNIKQCFVIFPIYVPILPIPPPVTSFSFSS